MDSTLEVKMSYDDLQKLLAERDALRDEIHRLTSAPIAFSLEDMAQRFERRDKFHLTPDQRDSIATWIRDYRSLTQ